MKKLISFGLVVLGFALLSVKAEAAGAARSPKGSMTVAYTTTVSSPSATAGPVVVYSVVLSTGATGDFIALFDTSTVSGISSSLTTTGVLKTRCMAGSTITTTMCNYDPPLQFNLGLAAVLSTSADHALITYEKGRVTNP